MELWLQLAGVIDSMNEAVARCARWALLANALLVAGNAISRKLFSLSAPVIYDLQWHFLAAVVLLMAAYTLQRDDHVRVDVLAQRMGERGMAWLDLFGMALVLVPLCILVTWVTLPSFLQAFFSGESRATREIISDLPAWIIKGFIPAGFLLLALQGIAEVIRCVDCLRGWCSRPVYQRRLIDGIVH